jgi:hypothetical protein
MGHQCTSSDLYRLARKARSRSGRGRSVRLLPGFPYELPCPHATGSLRPCQGFRRPCWFPGPCDAMPCIMTRDEYEQRQRRLEDELRAGVALLETAYRHQVRALQLVWAASGGDVEIPPSVVATLPAMSASVAPALPALLAAPPQPARRGAWELFNDVQSAIDEAPEVFDRNDICRILGYEPNRGSLYRTLQELIEDGACALEERGTGKVPTRYRKTEPSDATADG